EESLVTESTTLEANFSIDGITLDASLVTEGVVTEACFVTEGTTLESCLVNEGIGVNDNTGIAESSGTESENSSSTTPFSRLEDENKSSDKDSTNADIGPSHDSDTVTEVPHSSNDTFENVFAHGIRSHKQPESIPDTYKVNENNSNIISHIPNMDPDRDKEEHDDALGFENQNDYVNLSLLNKAKELAPCLYNIEKIGKDELSDHKIISEEESKCEAKKRLKVKQRKSLLSYHGFVYAETQFEETPNIPLKRRNINLKEHLAQVQLRNYDPKLWNSLPMKYFCYVKQAMLKFEKQTFIKIEINRGDLFRMIFEHSINERVRNQLSEEFEPFVKNVNLQLKYFEKSLTKEMKDDLKYIVSLEDELNEACLILDIQQEFFKTQFESAISESYSRVYKNEMFEENFALENENCCLKKTITQL
nr:reverse transcriptase zinc-binding domain-containing protein [Tanacetum cinerariifolium]